MDRRAGGGETIMATSEVVHAHAGPQGFIRKYIFSLDHKVIGIQYFFLALTALVLVASSALFFYGLATGQGGS